MNIVIGGGVAGCYIGLQLQERGLAFIILERASEETAGKQQTLNRKGVNLELGSSEQHLNQTNFLDLLTRLGLREKIATFTNTTPYLIYKNMSPEECKRFFDAASSLLSRTAIKSATSGSITLEKLSREVLGGDWEKYSVMHPFWFEIREQDAFTYFSCLAKEGEYFYLKGGQHQILQAAHNLLKDNIRYNAPVHKISRVSGGYEVTAASERVTGSKMFICCNLSSAKKIKYERCPEIPRYLDCAKSMACVRWYCVFKKPLNLPVDNFAGDFPGKWSMKLNDFVWLISYVDGPLVAEVKKENLAKRWISFVKSRFGADIAEEDIEEQVVAEWSDAYNILTPKWWKSLHVLPPDCFVTSVAKPCGQAWIDGALLNLRE
jgi:monoamine oxidase